MAGSLGVTIDEAIARAKAAIAERERRERPPPERQARPSKDEAWMAWMNQCAEAERPADRDEFERWWAGS